MVHSSSSLEIAGANSSTTSPFPGMMARSCPKPILMPRRSRQGTINANQDELSVFVPPHELSSSHVSPARLQHLGTYPSS